MTDEKNIGVKDELENIDLETDETINKELSEEDRLLYRLQEIDVSLERYEDILPENLDEETFITISNLKQEMKEIKATLKEKQKKEIGNSIWDKINIGYIIYGVLAFLVGGYPLGPVISIYYFGLIAKLAPIMRDYNFSDGVQEVILFALYCCYYLIFIIGDLIFYRFIKKNKVNFYTMIIITGIHLIVSIILILIVARTFFS